MSYSQDKNDNKSIDKAAWKRMEQYKNKTKILSKKFLLKNGFQQKVIKKLQTSIKKLSVLKNVSKIFTRDDSSTSHTYPKFNLII